MAVNDAQLGVVLRAVSDSTRRRLLGMIAREPGLTTAEVTRRVENMSRWGVMKHLAVLESAGLIQSLPEGRNTRHFSERQALESLRTWLASQPD
jgi:predicted transcriptional regulator